MTMRELMRAVPPNLVIPHLGHVRRFADSDGVEWTVRERFDGGRALVFEASGVLCHLSRYPANWHLVSEDYLEELLLNA